MILLHFWKAITMNRSIKEVSTMASGKAQEMSARFATASFSCSNTFALPVNRKSKEVKLVELTVPWDTVTNMTAAQNRKTERYKELATTIAGNGFKCLNIPLEIGTRGVVNTRNRGVLTQLCHSVKVSKVSSVIKNCSKLAILGSYTLWNARYSQDWNGSGYLQP